MPSALHATLVPVVIAIDPHKASWSAVAVDKRLQPLAAIRVEVNRGGYRKLRRFASRWSHAAWAIEGATGLGAALTARLAADGVDMVDVPAKLARRVRMLSTGHGRKTDQADALSVGIAAHTATRLSAAVVDEAIAALRVLTGHRDDLVRQVAAELPSEVRRLDRRIAEATATLSAAVAASDTTLTGLHGIGDVLAAKILARSGAVSRFRSESAFASYCGVAPIEVSSGDDQRHRLSRAGDRQLNYDPLHPTTPPRLRRRRPQPAADQAAACPRRPHQRRRASRTKAKVRERGRVLEPHRTSGVRCGSPQSAPDAQEVLAVHRNAPLSETGWLRLARCAVEDGWPLRRNGSRSRLPPPPAGLGRYRQL